MVLYVKNENEKMNHKNRGRWETYVQGTMVLSVERENVDTTI